MRSCCVFWKLVVTVNAVATVFLVLWMSSFDISWNTVIAAQEIISHYVPKG